MLIIKYSRINKNTQEYTPESPFQHVYINQTERLTCVGTSKV